MRHTNKALVLGGETGLLGQALCASLKKAGWDYVATTQRKIRFSRTGGIKEFEDLIGEVNPDCVFNTIAYTAVDLAEDNYEDADFLNREVPKLLAKSLKGSKCRLIHYSTDFVFDGKSDEPYTELSPTNPLSVYGATKLAGEREIIESGLDSHTIIRTAWLFGPGKKNFITTILSKCAEAKPLRVVHDQIGCPTYTIDLSTASVELAKHGLDGIFHVVNSGQASWCEFAAEAVRLTDGPCTVSPISSHDYVVKARRPEYSVLNTDKYTKETSLVLRPWTQALQDYIFSCFPVSAGEASE